jgi:CheY-like chemotaxis protein
MSLGSELAPHLPFLRRYARALFGSQTRGDAFVRHVLEIIVQDPDRLRPYKDVRVGLYALFSELVRNPPEEVGHAEPDTDAGSEEPVWHRQYAEMSIRRLSRMTNEQREALLLTSLEGFSSQDAAVILQTTPEAVDNHVAAALEEIEKQTFGKVLIIEDEPIIALDLVNIVQGLGHEVVGVAVTKDEAVGLATDDVGLVLADIQLADDSSGIDAIVEIIARRQRPVIFITAFPERLLDEKRVTPTFLITKPFQRSTVKAAIAQALFFDAATLPPEEPEEARSESPPATTEQKRSKSARAEPISASQLRPRLAPVDAEVRGGQLQIAPAELAHTALSSEEIETIRQLHLPTAKRLCSELQQTNIGPGPIHRLAAIAGTLAEPITRAASIRLGVQAAGLLHLVGSVSEVVDETRFADLQAFTRDLIDLARQFPAYREFIREAQAFDAVTSDSEASVSQLASELMKQPDDVVAPDLKNAISEVSTLARDIGDPLSRFALFRTIGNVLRAIARWLIARAAGVAARANTTFDEDAGKLVEKRLVTLVIGGPIALLASQLVMSHPQELSFVIELLRLAKEVVFL